MSILLLFSHQVVSNSSRPHGLQHTRFPCASPSPRVCPSSCPLNQWCHPTIIPFSSCLQSLPESGSFPVSLLFVSGGQSIGAIDWFDLLAVQGILKSLLQYHSSKASILWHSALVSKVMRWTCRHSSTAATITWVLFPPNWAVTLHFSKWSNLTAACPRGLCPQTPGADYWISQSPGSVTDGMLSLDDLGVI